MCLTHRKKSKFLPETVKTAYKVVTFGHDANKVYSSYRNFPIETGKWVKAKSPKTRGFCVFQCYGDARDDTFTKDVVLTVRVRKIVASGTFGGAPCWAAAEIFIPCQTPKT